MNNLAHTGHPHLEQTIKNSLAGEIFINCLPFLLLAAIVAILTYGFKTKLSVKLIVVMAYLLIIGLTTYKIAPVASIISLIAGFGLALATMLIKVKN